MQGSRSHRLTQPISVGFDPGSTLKGVLALVHFVTPLRLVRRARPVRQCPDVASLSELLAALPRSSGVRLPSTSPGCRDNPAAGSCTPHEPAAPRGAPALRGRDRCR